MRRMFCHTDLLLAMFAHNKHKAGKYILMRTRYEKFLLKSGI